MFNVKVSEHPKIKDIYVYSNGFIFNCKTNRFVTNTMNHSGYYSVSTFGKHGLVHRLVVEAFIGEIPEKMEVNHLDGNKINNDISNLEICTRSDNMLHAHSNDLCLNKAKGETHGMSTISNQKRNEIANLINRAEMPLKDISVALGVSINIVYHMSKKLRNQSPS